MINNIRLIKYKGVLQQDTSDCGPACIASICKFYGVNISINKIRDYAYTSSKSTTAKGLEKAAKKLGFDTKCVKSTKENALLTEFHKPAIAHIVTSEGFLHYVVVYKVTKHKVIIFDPAEGIKKIRYSEFIKSWTGVLILISPTSNFKELRSDESINLVDFMGYILKDKSAILSIIICTFITTILGIFSSLYLKFIIDDILPSKSLLNLSTISILMIVVAIVTIILNYTKNWISAIFSERLELQYNTDFFTHILKLPADFFCKREIGSVLNKFNDLAEVLQTLSVMLFNSIIQGGMAILGGIILYNQSEKLFKLSIIPLILYFIVMYSFKNIFKKKNKRYLLESDKLNSLIIESLENIEAIKYNNLEEDTTNKYLEKSINVSMLGLNINKVIYFQEFLTSIIKLTYNIGLIWYGTYLVINNELSLGSLMAFISLSVYFIGPVEALIGMQAQIYKGIVSLNRVTDIIQMKCEDEDDSLSLESIESGIEFKNVNFQYDISRKVLQNVNFNILKSDKVAIIGKSGSGKSTIAKLILKLQKCNSGNIAIDKSSISNYSCSSIRKLITYIPQKSSFFYGSIYENITFKNNEISLSEVVKVCEKVGIHHIIESLPEKYLTKISNTDMPFSLGEIQKLGIARALINKPAVLILDESTSNIDEVDELNIIKYLINSMKGNTIILITHNLNLVKFCSKVIKINSHKVESYINENENEDELNKFLSFYE
ncbi:MAG: peptidase domain-containing ABC transporter [Clostridium sp.]